MEKKSINVALTIPPTILHSGIFVALSKGYYKEEGLHHVNISWPKDENRTGEEDMKETLDNLSNKKADIMLGSFSTVIRYNTMKRNRIPLVAVSGVTQKDVTGFISLKKSGIDSLKKLDGKKVGLFGLPFEEACLRELSKRDGGKGDFQVIRPPFQHTLDGLKEGKYDACHIICPWHGARAKKENMDITMLGPFDRYGVPRHYPVLICLKDIISEKKPMMRSFLRATARGYCDIVKSDPKEIAMILRDAVQHDNMRDTDFIEESLRESREYFDMKMGDNERWGMMKEEDWKKFVHYLSERNLLVDEEDETIKEESVNIKSLFCNDLLMDL